MIYLLIDLHLLLDMMLYFSLLPFNIVFGYKQAQQYSRIHPLGFIRAVRWSAQNSESHWSHVHINFSLEHFHLSCIL